MSWKCVLVGLALVLPGTLLSVEGRHNNEIKVADREQQYLDSVAEMLKPENEDTGKAEKRDPDQVNGEDTNPPAPAAAVVDDGRVRQEGRDLNLKAVEPVALPLSHSQQKERQTHNQQKSVFSANFVFIVIVAGCTALAVVGIVGAGVCWYKYHKRVKAASVVEYPAYGVTGPTKDHLPSAGDHKLAKSAQMFHYQHQKEQMIAMEKANGSMKHDASDEESEEDNVEGDYTVYECPGLAPTGEMEVKNPLFRGDDTPSTPATEDSQRPAEDK